MHLLDPDVVVLGGGLGTSGTRPRCLVAELLPGLLHRPDPPAVEVAVAGAQAGLIGAGLLGAPWTREPSPERPDGPTP